MNRQCGCEQQELIILSAACRTLLCAQSMRLILTILTTVTCSKAAAVSAAAATDNDIGSFQSFILCLFTSR